MSGQFESGNSKFEDDRQIDALLEELEGAYQTDAAARRQAAFSAEARPVPEGLLWDGPSPGHIAFMGDFDTKEPPA